MLFQRNGLRYFFYSNEASESLPTLRTYATRVREMLEQFEASAPAGKLVVNVVDPLPFSEEEDRAEQFGLQGAQLGTAGESVYFGLAGSNSIGTASNSPVLAIRPRSSLHRIMRWPPWLSCLRPPHVPPPGHA